MIYDVIKSPLYNDCYNSIYHFCPEKIESKKNKLYFTKYEKY